jgi:GWxTD domain-containing protein
MIFAPDHGFASQDYKSIFPIRSTGPIKFDLDISQFDGGEDSTRVEFYYSVYLTSGDSANQTENNRSTLDIFLKILSDSGIVLDQFHEEKTISLYDSLQPSPNTTFINMKSLSLLPDTVTVQLIIQDKISGKKGQIFKPLQIRYFDNTFSLSDFYFVSHIQKASGSVVFERHGVMMVPHPSRTFFISDDTQKAFIFYEINNLTFEKSKQSVYDAIATVFDVKGNEVFKNVKELIKISSTNSSRIEVIPIGKLNNGIYKILVQVLDRESGIRQEITGRFRILKDSKETNILPMSDEEAQKYLDQIKYIATDRELDIYKQLNPQGKQEFLLQFWKSRDSNPNTTENEFMLEHFRRLSIVEEKFKGGINSDMGRIYIKYGPPLEIERQTGTAEISQTIEHWIYALEGRTDFVFVDRIGDGKYVLVHSTHLDEFSNPGWQQDL